MTVTTKSPVVFEWYAGIKCERSQWVPEWDIEAVSPGFMVMGNALAEEFNERPDRQQILDDMTTVARALTKGEQPKDLTALTWVENTMRYTVGTSNRPVNRADKERKQRLGIESADRLADLGTEVRRLLKQTTKLNTMSEGQYVEFVKRRRALMAKHAELSDVLAQVEADLELVQFACDEAGER